MNPYKHEDHLLTLTINLLLWVGGCLYVASDWLIAQALDRR